MSTEKVAYASLVNAVVRMDNSVDAERVYEITSAVNIDDDTRVSSFNNGIVKKDGQQVATFNAHGETNLSINFSINESVEQCEITKGINAFMQDAKSKVSISQPLNI